MTRLLESGGLRGTEGTTFRALEDYVSAAALTLVQGAYGGGVFKQGGIPPEQESMDLPDWAVTAGELLIVGLGTCKGDTPPDIADPFWSLTGGGLTWTRQVKAHNSALFTAETAIFTAIATSTTTITDMVGVPNSNNLSVCYTYAKATGYNASSPIGATAGVADGSLDGQKDITLSGTPASTSYIYAVAFENADDNATSKGIDHGSSAGWTEAFDNGPAMTGGQIYGVWEGQYKTGHTSTTVRWDDIKPAAQSGTTFSFAGCAIEIRAA